MDRVFCALGVDVGGTRVSAALVGAEGRCLELQRRPTPRSDGAEATLPLIAEMIDVILAATEVRPVGIGIGFGGPVDHRTRRIRRSHHAPGWADVDPSRFLGPRFGLPVWLENDANAAGLGELVFGAARGAAACLYVNIGTGVGGAILVDGAIHHGAHGNAGEFGHMVLDPTGPECPCGKRGCVEALCSGDAIGRMARQRWGDRPGEPPAGKDVGALAGSGDPWALAIVAQAAEHMGRALAIACNLLDPEIVVLGGGVPEIGEAYMQPVRDAFGRYAMPVPAERTRVVAASLGYDAGVVGAAAVALLSSIAS